MAAVWINTMDPKQSTADSAGSRLFQFAREGNTEKLREILLKGGPLSTDTVGTTALHCAVLGDHLDTCDLLIRAGISIDAKTKVDRTPLHLAAYCGHERVARKLLDMFCQVDPVDLLLMTPLHWAVQKRHPQIVELLLGRGADPFAISKFSKSPRSIAQSEGFFEIVQLLDNFIGLRNTASMETHDAAVSLILEMKKERGLPNSYHNIAKLVKNEEEMSDMIDYDGGGENNNGEDANGEEPDGTVSIFEVDDNENDDEDEGVEVIPVDDPEERQDQRGVGVGSSSSQVGGDGDGEQPEDGRLVAHDSDESFSNLHETIDKLGNIRGLKQTDATTLKILQNIGIQITEDHDPTIISNVLQSGRKIILSEAGKYVLDQTKSSEDKFNFGAPNQQQVPMSTSTPLSNKEGSMTVQKLRVVKSKVPPPCSSSSLVRPAAVPLTSLKSVKRENNNLNVFSAVNSFVNSSSTSTTTADEVDLKPFATTVNSSGHLVLRRKRTSSGMVKDFSSDLNRVQNMEPSEVEYSASQDDNCMQLSGSFDGCGDQQQGGETVQVPLNRIQKMEQQMLVLRRENQQLRNKLELSLRLIEDNRKRIERMEETGTLRKEEE